MPRADSPARAEDRFSASAQAIKQTDKAEKLFRLPLSRLSGAQRKDAARVPQKARELAKDVSASSR